MAKKKIEIENEPSPTLGTVYLEYTDDHRVIEDDGKEYGWREDEYHFMPKTLHQTQNDKYYHLEHIDVAFTPERGREYFVVYVIYSTGCTFGRSEGVHKIIDVLDSEDDADAIKTIIEKGSTEGDGYQYHVEVPKTIKTTWDGYCGTWVGYFERFTSCEVVPMILRK